MTAIDPDELLGHIRELFGELAEVDDELDAASDEDSFAELMGQKFETLEDIAMAFARLDQHLAFERGALPRAWQRDAWQAAVEAKHGLPLDEIVGHVYVLHYEVPQEVKSVSDDYAGPSPRSDAYGYLSAAPIRHYVGWTQQARPSKRIANHGPAALREVVYLEPGTTKDERAMKHNGTCPKCGESLAASLA